MKAIHRQPLSYHLACLTAATLCFGSNLTAAENPPAAKKGWETTAAAAATLTRGNSETFLATVSLDTKRKWTQDEAAFGVSGGYGNTKINGQSEDNAKFIQGYGQYNRLFTERLYAGLRLDGQYDGIAGVDYRFQISPLVGYYLIKKPQTTFAVEAGPALVIEKLKGSSEHSFWGARFGEHFDHQLTDTTKIWERVEYTPQVDRWADKYLITGEAGIDTSITKHWSLRVVFQDNYDSQPAVGRKKNDIRLMAGTAYKF